MPVIYRVQSYPETDDWYNQYEPTQMRAKGELDKCTAREIPARLDKLEVPTDREGLCDFLNTVLANHLNQEPSEFIARNY